MDAIRDQFTTGRRAMIDAFAELSGLARRAGADDDHVTTIHGQFFDDNIAIKRAFWRAIVMAEIRRPPS